MRLAIAGCGFVTGERHLPALRAVSGVDVVALADTDFARCERLADQFGVRHRYDTFDALLEHRGIEAVAVCTPAATHAELAGAALDAGKHVFVEKPLALSLDDADTLVAHAGRSTAIATVGFNLRWHRLVRQARALLRERSIGRVTAIATAFTDARLALPGLPSWRRQRELGGGVIVEKLVHHFDLWRFLLDDEPVEVFAVSRSGRADDEVAMVTARMRGGALAQAHASDVTSMSNELTVYGEEGALHVDLYRFDGLHRSSLDHLPGAPATRMRRVLAAAAQLSRSIGDVRRGGLFQATYAAEWSHFAAAVRRTADPGCTFEDGRRALRIALAAAGSASSGLPVSVEGAPATLPVAARAPAVSEAVS